MANHHYAAPMVGTSGRRTRASIVEQNDAAIRDALIEMACDVGWDGVTFSGVASRAGLTVGAVYGRAESQAELGIDLWESRVREWFAEVCATVQDAGSRGDATAVGRALQRWHAQPSMTAVVIDLLIGSLFDDDLDEVVGTDVRAALGAYCSPSSSPKVSAQAAAAGALLHSFSLGHALALRGGVHLGKVSAQRLEALAGLLVAPPSRRRAPSSPPLEWVRPMDDVDPSQRAILRGTVDVLGRVGYRRATIARIGRAAQVPRGSVMSHYASKADLVGEAARLALIPPGEVWEQYSGVVDVHGPLTARAAFLHDFLKPSNRELWAVNLELARVGRYVPQVGQFRASANVLEHTHLGVMLVASYVPGLDRLNFMGPFQAGTAT